jgi:hypothetical protein
MKPRLRLQAPEAEAPASVQPKTKRGHKKIPKSRSTITEMDDTGEPVAPQKGRCTIQYSLWMHSEGFHSYQLPVLGWKEW